MCDCVCLCVALQCSFGRSLVLCATLCVCVCVCERDASSSVPRAGPLSRLDRHRPHDGLGGRAAALYFKKQVMTAYSAVLDVLAHPDIVVAKHEALQTDALGQPHRLSWVTPLIAEGYTKGERTPRLGNASGSHFLVLVERPTLLLAGRLRDSAKLLWMWRVFRKAAATGEKLIVVSQCLTTLACIEVSLLRRAVCAAPRSVLVVTVAWSRCVLAATTLGPTSSFPCSA